VSNRCHDKLGPIFVVLISSGVVPLGACSSNAELAYSGYSAGQQYEIEPRYGRGLAVTPDAPIENEACRTVVKRRSDEYGRVTEEQSRVCGEENREAWRETYQGNNSNNPDLSIPDQAEPEDEPE
jgi:hypothetical protein